MKKENVELSFIEFDDIRVGDIIVLQDDEDFMHCRVIEITDDRILAYDSDIDEHCRIHKQDFNKRAGLLAECRWDYKYVDSILRTEVLWECVDSQVYKALH